MDGASRICLFICVYLFWGPQNVGVRVPFGFPLKPPRKFVPIPISEAESDFGDAGRRRAKNTLSFACFCRCPPSPRRGAWGWVALGATLALLVVEGRQEEHCTQFEVAPFFTQTG